MEASLAVFSWHSNSLQVTQSYSQKHGYNFCTGRDCPNRKTTLGYKESNTIYLVIIYPGSKECIIILYILDYFSNDVHVNSLPVFLSLSGFNIGFKNYVQS